MSKKKSKKKETKKKTKTNEQAQFTASPNEPAFMKRAISGMETNGKVVGLAFDAEKLEYIAILKTSGGDNYCLARLTHERCGPVLEIFGSKWSKASIAAHYFTTFEIKDVGWSVE